MVVENELCAAVSEVLQKLGFDDFTIQLNHRDLLTALLEAVGIDAPLHGTALVAIDKLDKIGVPGVRTELIARGISDASAEALLGAFEDHSRLNRLVGESERGEKASAQIAEIITLAQATPARGRIQFAPRLARGLSYYTGAIMEVAVPDLAGSLGGGGRYDGLIGIFLGEDVPACGFSLGLERILVVMGERKMFPAEVQRPSADVLVSLFDEAAVPEALRLAAELRAGNVRVEVYPEPDKLGKQMKYAATKKIPVAAILGGDELARGEVTLKNLQTGTHESVARATVAEWIKRGRSSA